MITRYEKFLVALILASVVALIGAPLIGPLFYILAGISIIGLPIVYALSFAPTPVWRWFWFRPM
ncbi:MAG: hypothetical protein WAT09_11645 [Paracoccaceae bacterium]